VERCQKIIENSLRRAGSKSNRVTEANRQKILQALGPLSRKKAKRVVYKLTPNALKTISTKERASISCSAAELRRGDKTVFYGPNCEASIPDEQLEFFCEVKDPDGDFRAGCEFISNSHDFKTPCNMVVADATPERKFTRELCKRENAVALDAWLKNTSQRFYTIEYAWKKSEHPKRGEFSPDFFIKKGKTIHVIEIKDDSEINDPSRENQKKYEYAEAHFEKLNQWLLKEDIAVKYQFNFLTPKSFNLFFQLIRNDELKDFRSELDVTLSRNSLGK
jgi:type III restriction enzyme